MAELTCDLFVSADGYAAGDNTEAFFGYDGPDLQAWIASASHYRILVGRNTYETFPDLAAAVYSNTLTSAGSARLLSGDLTRAVTEFKAGSDGPIRTIGSLRLVAGLLAAGLVDHLRLMVFPVTMGADGREHIELPRVGYELAESRVLDGRLVLLDYRPGTVGPAAAS
ncbi:dihydrofolate reductase family protein [Dactylosporangium sp. CA-139114]|uniref:dihydrofolate reductase family protein n=1 Tax=Dactylosporangium sp. CA-139114 TaxID=3239931 RepID=UPI003D951C50